MEVKQSLEATCPECHGPLSQIRQGEFCEYRCLVGHAYSARNLVAAHSEALEQVLWSAVVMLEMAPIIAQAVASQFPVEIAERLQARARETHDHAKDIRSILERLEPLRTE